MTTPGVGMVAPNNLASMDVDSALLRTIWQTRVYTESLLPEPLFNNEHLMATVDLGSGESIDASGKCFVDITPADKGARKITLSFLRAINASAIEGNSTAYIGNETNLRMKSASFYANDYGIPVTSFEYGIDFRELDSYKIYEKVSPLLWQWLGEYRGFCARHALCENMSHNLTAAPISLTATPNAHIWFPVLTDAQQPQFVTSTTEYAEAIGDAATQAGASRTTNQLTVAALLDAASWAQDWYGMPVDVGGYKVYLLGVSKKQALRLRKPSTTDGVGIYWDAGGKKFDTIADIVPDLIGVVGDVAVFQDERAPTYTLGGSNSAWTNTFGYVQMGRTDGRTTSVAATAFDVNILYAEKALVKYESATPAFNEQFDDYDRYKGDLIHGAMGYQTCRWDIDTASDSDKMQQEGCGLILTNRV